MKSIALLIAVVFLTGSTAKAQKPLTPKAYTVTLSLDQWQNILTQVDSTRKILLDSDVPTRKTVYATSALSLITQTISMQVSQQLAAEQKAADTTKPKTQKK